MVESTIKTGFANQAYLKETRGTTPQEAPKNERTREAQKSSIQKSDVVELSTASQKLRQAEEAVKTDESARLAGEEAATRERRLQSIRDQISSGTYNVNAEQIAGKMAGTLLEEFV